MSSPLNRWFSENIGDDISDLIVRIRVELPRGKVVERDVQPDLEINYDLLELQLEETPSIYIFWSAMLSEQKRRVAELERTIARRRARVCELALKTARENKLKIPKYELDEIVELDDQYLKLNTELFAAQQTVGKLWAIVDAIKMKSEHLRSLAGFKRQEMRDSGGFSARR